jgi:hypothetical protein
MQTRKYSSISQDTTLAAGGISASATSMTVATGTGGALMGGIVLTPGDTFQVAIDPDTVNEELVFITAQSADVFTITRAVAGTSAVVHAAGATVKHVLSSDDLNYFNTTSPASLALAKGSITVATGEQAVAGLPVGTNDYVLTADSAEISGVKWAAVPTVSLNLTLNAKTGSYTLLASDVNKLVTVNSSSSATITVPNGVFSVGNQINVASLGTGLVTIDSDGTTVLRATPGTVLRAQYSSATIICIATNTFLIVGDLAV